MKTKKMQAALTEFISEEIQPDTEPEKPLQKIQSSQKNSQKGKIIRIDSAGKLPTEINQIIRENASFTNIHPDDLIRHYEGLGVEKRNSKGLVGIYETRKKHLGQFFTPLWVSKLIVDILKIPKNATVLDNSMGTGRLAWHLPNKKLFTGIEYEETAYKIAKRLYPDSCIIQDDLINHPFDEEFDYVIINPPFSLDLKSNRGHLIHVSYGGGIKSHVAALEIGLRAVKKTGYLAAILPGNIWKNETTRVLHRWMRGNGLELAKITLPKDTFIGTEWETAIYLFKKISNETKPYSQFDTERFDYNLTSTDHIKDCLKKIRSQKFYRDNKTQIWGRNSTITEYAKMREELDTFKPVLIEPYSEVSENAAVKLEGRKLPMNKDPPSVTVVAVKNKLRFIPNNALAAIKIEHAKARFSYDYDHSIKEYVSQLDTELCLDAAWTGEKTLKEYPIFSTLRELRLKYEIHPSVHNYLKKKKRFFERESAAFEQWIKPADDAEWEIRFEDEGIRQNFSREYNKLRSEFYNHSKEYPHLNILYDFQKDDLFRLALKRSAIIAWQQGLGKTKLGISLAIIRKTQSNLYIVPPHLKDTWLKEFKNFGIKPHIINNKKDLKKLSRFNLITYNALKKKVDPKETRWRSDNKSSRLFDDAKTFADILKRRFKLIIVDEAHALSNKTTKQSRAVAKMKPKYWYLMTGTPIGNTVKNIYSLVDIAWKAHSPFFPYSTKDFREQFVSVEWVTPEFDDTLSKGRTSQEMADVKDVDEFIELMKGKWLRRVKAEPEVKRCIDIPKPRIRDISIKPNKEQLMHYKKHLKDFSDIFRRFMKPQDSEDHRINQSIVLAQLQNLQFCSIIPQHKKVNPSEEYTYQGGTTATQTKIIDLIKKHHAEKKKIIIFTQRPDLCTLIEKLLKKDKISAKTFTGKIPIDKRNKRLDAFKNGNVNVLLSSINVTDTGLNIPEANIAIIVEADWKWSKIDQAYCRILRPQTKERPTVYCLHTKGTIDEYLWQHAYRKKDAIDETLEGKTDIMKGDWVHWKDFIVSMLRAEGLWDD